jgi:hypothetical protein
MIKWKFIFINIGAQKYEKKKSKNIKEIWEFFYFSQPNHPLNQ